MGWLRVDPENLTDGFALRSQRFEPYWPTIILDRSLRSTNQKTPSLQIRYL